MIDKISKMINELGKIWGSFLVLFSVYIGITAIVVMILILLNVPNWLVIVIGVFTWLSVWHYFFDILPEDIKDGEKKINNIK